MLVWDVKSGSKQKMQLGWNIQPDISEIFGFYPDLFLQKSGGVFTFPCFLYICFSGFSPHKLLYEEKTTYQNFRIF